MAAIAAFIGRVMIALLFVLMLIPYVWAAWQRYESAARVAGQ